MNPFRGLFGSSAKNYVNANSNDVRVSAAPGSAADREFGDGAVLRRVPTLTPDLETPKQERAQKWQVVGATLADVGAALRGAQGGSLDRVQQGWRKRAAEEAAAKEMESLRALASDLYGDDQEAMMLFEAAPEAFIKQRLEERQPAKPVLVNTRLGPRLYNPQTEEYRTLENIPERLPPGYKYDDNGEVILDPLYVQGQGALAEARAAAAAKYRAPRGGGGGGGGGSRAAAAPASSRRRPWED